MTKEVAVVVVGAVIISTHMAVERGGEESFHDAELDSLLSKMESDEKEKAARKYDEMTIAAEQCVAVH